MLDWKNTLPDIFSAKWVKTGETMERMEILYLSQKPEKILPEKNSKKEHLPSIWVLPWKIWLSHRWFFNVQLR